MNIEYMRKENAMSNGKKEITYIDVEAQLRKPIQTREGIAILTGYSLCTATAMRDWIIESYINPTGLRVPKRKKYQRSCWYKY